MPTFLLYPKWEKNNKNRLRCVCMCNVQTLLSCSFSLYSSHHCVPDLVNLHCDFLLGCDWQSCCAHLHDPACYFLKRRKPWSATRSNNLWCDSLAQILSHMKEPWSHRDSVITTIWIRIKKTIQMSHGLLTGYRKTSIRMNPCATR